MAILAECPTCHKKQSARNKLSKCGENLDKAKQSRRVKYWIDYRLPNGKQKKESLTKFTDLNPTSIEDAKAALEKRNVQKREGRADEIFRYKKETMWTFKELAEW